MIVPGKEAAKYLEMAQGGLGVLLGGVTGVDPGHVLIIGGGVVGVNAARAACGLGAKVTILDTSLDRLRYLSDIMPKNCFPLMSSPAAIREFITRADGVDVFVRRNDLRGSRSLRKGQLVRFREKEGEKGIRAIKVKAQSRTEADS